MKSLNEFIIKSTNKLDESLGNLEGLPKELINYITTHNLGGLGGMNSPVELQKSKSKAKLIKDLRSNDDVLALVGKSAETGEVLFGIVKGDVSATRGPGKSLKVFTPSGESTKSAYKSGTTTKFYLSPLCGTKSGIKSKSSIAYDTSSMSKNDVIKEIENIPSSTKIDYYIYKVDPTLDDTIKE